MSDDDEGDLRTFSLVFEAVTCDDCDETVPVTRSCVCGAWTPRDDEHVTRRRMVVATLRPLLEAPVVPSAPIELASAPTFAVCSAWQLPRNVPSGEPLGTFDRDPTVQPATRAGSSDGVSRLGPDVSA